MRRQAIDDGYHSPRLRGRRRCGRISEAQRSPQETPGRRQLLRRFRGALRASMVAATDLVRMDAALPLLKQSSSQNCERGTEVDHEPCHVHQCRHKWCGACRRIESEAAQHEAARLDGQLARDPVTVVAGDGVEGEVEFAGDVADGDRIEAC
jgi:hypothetical protein